MSAVTLPTPLASDAETVTFRRSDWSAHVASLEHSADTQAVEHHMAWINTVGPDEALRLSYGPEEARRILDGASRVTIWRERAGLTQRALATLSEISPSYLAEIEAGRKPGSAVAIQALAKALRVPMEMLVE